METDKSVKETAINMPEIKSDDKAKAPLLNSSKAVAVTVEQPNRGSKKGIASGDFVLRLFAMGAALGAAVTMGNNQQILPFFTQFFEFLVQYNDITTFVYFVTANAAVAGYLFLSLPFSVICINRPLAIMPRLVLVIFDTVMMGITITAASASASIVYLAHNGNQNTMWLPFCQQFGNFCQTASGAVVGSLVADTLLMFIIILSAFALK